MFILCPKLYVYVVPNEWFVSVPKVTPRLSLGFKLQNVTSNEWQKTLTTNPYMCNFDFGRQNPMSNNDDTVFWKTDFKSASVRLHRINISKKKLLGSILTLASLRQFCPHFFDSLQHHVAMPVKCLNSSEQLLIVPVQIEKWNILLLTIFIFLLISLESASTISFYFKITNNKRSVQLLQFWLFYLISEVCIILRWTRTILLLAYFQSRMGLINSKSEFLGCLLACLKKIIKDVFIEFI